MRRWQAIPVAAVAALLTGVALFSSAPPVTTHAAPGDYSILLKCQVQASCVFPAGTTGVDIDVVISNVGAATTLSGFNFDVWNENDTLLAPGVPAPNLAFLAAAGWACGGPPPPAADNLTGAAGTSTSFLSCIDAGAPPGQVLPTGESRLATVHFTVPALATGVSRMILSNVALGDETATELAGCNPAADPPAEPVVSGPCTGVSVQIGVSASTATFTATPTSTATSLPPTITPTPGTPTTLAYVTVTPTGSPTVAATATPPAGTTPAATVSTGGGTGTTPGGGAGAGGAGPIRLPDTGAGSERGTDWTFVAMVALLALGAGGVAGGLYFGAASAAQGQRSRREG